MTSEPNPVRGADLDRAAAALEHVTDPAPLAALAYEVLGGQAEGRTLLAGSKLARTKAGEHGVTRELAETDAGNLLKLLERGATKPLERALVAAFMVRGLSDVVSQEGEADARGVVFRFVQHADWLELSGGYSVYALVDRLADEPTARMVWAELAARVVDEAVGRDSDRPDVRARNAARVTALSGSSAEAARQSLRGIIESAALDEPTRALARALAGDGPQVGSVVRPRVTGAVGRAPKSGAIEVLRWISGWAAAAWLLRAVGFLIGVRRRAELRMSGDALCIHRRTSLFGKTVREGEETWRLDAIDAAGRRIRYPALHLLVGAVAVSAGVLLGALLLFDGVRSGELVLVVLAAALVIVGAGLDLALDVLVPGGCGRVVMDLSRRSAPPLRLTRVPAQDADAFLRSLRNATTKR